MRAPMLNMPCMETEHASKVTFRVAYKVHVVLKTNSVTLQMWEVCNGPALDPSAPDSLERYDQSHSLFEKGKNQLCMGLQK